MYRFDGGKIVQYRNEKGLSQADLARMVTKKGQGQRQVVDQWERGERTPSSATIAKLATALGVPPGRFFVQTEDGEDA